MFYMRTLWFHDNNDDPSIIYSELDQNRYEVRKIEFFKSGNHLYASQEKERESCILGELPIPKIEEINNIKIRFSYEMYDSKNVLKAKAETVNVFVDNDGNLKRISDELLEKLTK